MVKKEDTMQHPDYKQDHGTYDTSSTTTTKNPES